MCLICNGTVAVVKSFSVKIEALKKMHMARFDVKFSPGSAARKEKVARVQNDYERQIGMVQNFPTKQSISSQISFSSDFRSFRALQL